MILKKIFLSILVLNFGISYSQIKNTKYCSELIKQSDNLFSILEIEIKNDSTYTAFYYSSGNRDDFKNYRNWKIEKKEGEIKTISGNKVLEMFEEFLNKKVDYPVKITKRKITFYGYKINNYKKKLKAFEMKVCQ